MPISTIWKLWCQKLAILGQLSVSAAVLIPQLGIKHFSNCGWVASLWPNKVIDQIWFSRKIGGYLWSMSSFRLVKFHNMMKGSKSRQIYRRILWIMLCSESHLRRLQLAARAFHVAAQTLWNNLPIAVTNSTSLYQLRCLLKGFVCLLFNGTSALFRPLVPRIVELEHTNHVKNDLK